MNLESTHLRIECPICLDPMRLVGAGNKEDKAGFIMYCGHAYHFHCLTQWFKIKHECPICRTEPVLGDMTLEVKSRFCCW